METVHYFTYFSVTLLYLKSSTNSHMVSLSAFHKILSYYHCFTEKALVDGYYICICAYKQLLVIAVVSFSSLSISYFSKHYFMGESLSVATVTGPLLVPKTALFHVALKEPSVLKPASILAKASLFLVLRTGSGWPS